MSTYISVENIGHSFHDKWLFRNITIGINRGRRVALVGINGAGKSTLLKILAGELNPVEGKAVRAKDLNVSYLNQDPKFEKDYTISDFIFNAENKQQQLTHSRVLLTLGESFVMGITFDPLRLRMNSSNMKRF